MFNEQSRLFQRFVFVTDLGLIAIGWILAYYLRFEVLAPIIGLPEWRPLSRYLPYVLPLMGVWGMVFLFSGLYATDRAQRLPLMIYAVARAVSLGMAASVAGMFFYRAFSFSRIHMLLFGIVTAGLMVGLRLALFTLGRRARRKGKNLRRVLIVGAGEVGQRLKRAFKEYPLMGFEVLGFLDDRKKGEDILGRIEMLPEVMDWFEQEERSVDAVYITLPLRAVGKIEQMMDILSTRLAHVYLIPDLFQFDVLNSRVSDVGGMPVIHLIDEVPLEFRRLVKRGIDVVFSFIVLILLFPLLLIIAIGVKLSSPGPVFYRQERMSLNGQRFYMLKFRSMPVNAESSSGPVWAKPGEDRATPLGAFLRRTSLDELPQFINVLKGDMSVVGPRPERPIFIGKFKGRIPRYMLRHKVKGGITGWAQVHGWRGNTSLEKRIEYDLYYIRNWSLSLDFKIMFMTVWSGFMNKNAY